MGGAKPRVTLEQIRSGVKKEREEQAVGLGEVVVEPSAQLGEHIAHERRRLEAFEDGLP